MLLDLISILAPVFICAGIGWAWARAARPFDAETVTSLVTVVSTPCLVFDTLVRLGIRLDQFAEMALATLMVMGGFAVGGLIVLKLRRLEAQAFLPSLMFPNAGNVGLSVSLFAFGEQGLALAIAYFGIMVALQFTVGVAINAGHMSVSGLIKSPTVWAVAAAIAFIAFEWSMPDWLGNTVHLLGGFAIPMMLIALGVSLARLRVTDLADSLIIALSRLAIGLGVGLGVSWILDLGPLATGVVVLQSAMPVAVFNYLFALRYDRRPETVAGAVVLSSLIGFATLPALLWFVLTIAGKG